MSLLLMANEKFDLMTALDENVTASPTLCTLRPRMYECMKPNCEAIHPTVVARFHSKPQMFNLLRLNSRGKVMGSSKS